MKLLKHLKLKGELMKDIYESVLVCIVVAATCIGAMLIVAFLLHRAWYFLFVYIFCNFAFSYIV